MYKREPFMLNAKEAANFCGISRSHLYKLLSRDLFPLPRRLGGCVRWAETQLVEYLLKPAACGRRKLRGVQHGSIQA